MILNVGKDMPFSYTFANCFLYGHLSTDTGTPVATDTSMAGWVKQTNTYGSGDGSAVVSGDIVTLTRSFVFTAETGDVTYTKFYSSPTSGSSASPFNEILFATPITLASGQQAKVTMSLAITITPHTTAATYAEDVISGVSGSTGTMRIPSFGIGSDDPMISTISSSGSSISGSDSWMLEPSAINTSYGRSSISTSRTTLFDATDGDLTTRAFVASRTSVALATYASGSFSRIKVALMDLSDCNATGIYSIGFYSSYHSPTHIGPQFLSDTAFTKLNTQKLTLNFTFSIT
jgi:hypothetical protein